MIDKNDTSKIPKTSSGWRHAGSWSGWMRVLDRPLFRGVVSVGVDLGHTTLKCARIIKQNSILRIEDLAIHDRPKDDAGYVANTLLRTVPSGAGLYLSHSGLEVRYQLVTLPVIPQKEIQSAVEWEMSKHFSYDIAEVYVEYIPTPFGKNNQKTWLGMAVRKSDLGRLCDELAPMVSRLESWSLVPMAYLNLVRFGFLEFSRETMTLVMDIGAKETTLVFFLGEHIAFCREVNIGGDDITRAMAGTLVAGDGRFTLDEQNAERIKRRYGLPLTQEEKEESASMGLGQIRAMIRPVLEKLVVEIKRSWGYCQSQLGIEKPQRIYLAGSGGKLKNLKDYLSVELDVPTEPLELKKDTDSLKRINSRVAHSDDKWEWGDVAVAIGMALEAFDKEPGLNFLPVSLKNRHSRHVFASAVQGLGVAALVLTVLFLSSTYHGWIAANAEWRELKKKKSEMEKLYGAMENERKGIRDVHERLAILESRLEERPIFDGFLKELGFIVPDNMALTLVSCRGNDLTIEGRLVSPRSKIDAAMAGFMITVEKSSFVEHAAWGTRNKRSAGDTSEEVFQLQCRLLAAETL